jgi:hypothetical protein
MVELVGINQYRARICDVLGISRGKDGPLQKSAVADLRVRIPPATVIKVKMETAIIVRGNLLGRLRQ